MSYEIVEWIDATKCDVYWGWSENQGRKEGEVNNLTRPVDE